MKLQSNPHYKMSAKQRKQMEDEEGTVQYSTPQIHNNHFQLHPVELKKKRTYNKKKKGI